MNASSYSSMNLNLQSAIIRVRVRVRVRTDESDDDIVIAIILLNLCMNLPGSQISIYTDLVLPALSTINAVHGASVKLTTRHRGGVSLLRGGMRIRIRPPATAR